MRAIGAILAAIAGAVLGYWGAFAVGYPIVVAMDGPDRDGGIAMGVALTLGPAMAAISALVFLFAVLWLTRPKSRAQTGSGPGPDDAPDKVVLPPPGATPGPNTQSLVAISVVMLAIVAGAIWLNSD